MQAFVYHIKPAMVNGYLDNPRKIDSAWDQMQVRMNKVRVKQGKEPLKRLRLHDLRHSNISALLNGGIPVVFVAANSGHVFKS
jgi:integrase